MPSISAQQILKVLSGTPTVAQSSGMWSCRLECAANTSSKRTMMLA
jgi:hypothetical protein